MAMLNSSRTLPRVSMYFTGLDVEVGLFPNISLHDSNHPLLMLKRVRILTRIYSASQAVANLAFS